MFFFFSPLKDVVPCLQTSIVSDEKSANICTALLITQCIFSLAACQTFHIIVDLKQFYSNKPRHSFLYI